MTPEQKAAYINGQVACALAEIEGMRAENWMRQSRGEALAYTFQDFENIPIRYGIHHNAVIGFFRD